MRYDLYKDSGVKWIGEIPDHWDIKKNKYFTQSQKNKSEKGEEELLSVSEKLGVISRKSIREDHENLTRSESLVGYLKVKKGELVSNIMLMWKRGLGVSERNGIVSPSYSVFSFLNSEPKYFHYLFRTDQYVAEFRRNSTGVIESRLRLYDDSFGSLKSHFPPLNEQKKIVGFLDKKTTQIDKLIKKIEQKIELLKEQRTSLINEVVTKGLDPNVEMKGSGFEWIGEIPTHWETKKLKYLFSLFGGKDVKNIQEDDGRYPIFGTGGEIDRSKEYLYDKRTVLLGRKGTIDRPFLVDEPFWVSDVMYFTVQKTDMTPDYLLYLLNTFPFDFYVYGSTQPSMNRRDYENHFFPVPPKEEQQKIKQYLDEKTKIIHETISKEEKRIELLKEYKQSLISEVVTGKKRVV